MAPSPQSLNFTDEQSLKDWLQTRSQAECVVIARRTAAASASFTPDYIDAATDAVFPPIAPAFPNMDPAFLAAASQDANFLNTGGTVDQLSIKPLWWDQNPDWFISGWNDMKETLLSDPQDHWDIWVNHYDGLIKGKPYFPEKIVDQIFMIEDDDWKKRHRHINQMIKGWMDGYNLSNFNKYSILEAYKNISITKIALYEFSKNNHEGLDDENVNLLYDLNQQLTTIEQQLKEVITENKNLHITIEQLIQENADLKESLKSMQSLKRKALEKWIMTIAESMGKLSEIKETPKIFAWSCSAYAIIQFLAI